jgi:hypothetical protein
MSCYEWKTTTQNRIIQFSGSVMLEKEGAVFLGIVSKLQSIK